MARPSAHMLTAGEKVTTGPIAAPTVDIICFPASFGDRLFTAKTGLAGAHQVAGRTGARMALKWARVRASCTSLGAGLATRMRGQACDRLGVELLSTPAVIRTRRIVQWGVASWTPPQRMILLILLCLIGMPFLNTGQVHYSPAYIARPYLRLLDDLTGADNTFILKIGDVFMNAGWKIRRFTLWSERTFWLLRPRRWPRCLSRATVNYVSTKGKEKSSRNLKLTSGGRFLVDQAQTLGLRH